MDLKTGRRIVSALALLLPLCLATPVMAQQDPSRWMGELATDPRYPVGGPSPMDQSLAEFIFPGTHSSGAYRLRLAVACDACRDRFLQGFITGAVTPLGPAEFVAVLLNPWAQTQDLDIRGQLELGARAFDLRFFRADASDVAESGPFFDNLAAHLEALGAADSFELEPLTQGDFYIHNTFAGPSAAEIFAGIQAFLAEAGRQNEIIILNFSAMNEGSGEMSPASLRDFFRQLFDTVGTSFFAPASDGQTTLRTLQNAGQQVIATLDSNTVPAWQPGVDDDISNLVWPAIAKADVLSVTGGVGGYPRPGSELNVASPGEITVPWNTEGQLFGWLENIAEQRTDPSAMFQMAVQFGPDDDSFFGFSHMLFRRFICRPTEVSTVIDEGLADYIELYTNVPVPPEVIEVLTTVSTYTEPGTPKDALIDAVKEQAKLVAYEEIMDAGGQCPAINDDWDRFRSLADVAQFTNPKVLPALVGLDRDDVNIVLAEFYPSEFTTEAMKLNRGAARVTFVVKDILELECHDCFPPNGPSNPDYYPLIDFLGDEWERWGGPWLERSGTHITPGWTAYRAVPAYVPSIDVRLRINDQDNRLIPGDWDINTDDYSQINGDAVELTTTRPVWGCEGSGCVVSLSYAGEDLTSSGDTGVFEYDSSRITYGIGVCQWSLPPGEVDRTAGCGPFTNNTPPIAEIIDPPALPLSAIEGQRIGPITGTGSDPDPLFINCDQDGNCDPAGWVVSYEWDCAYDGVTFEPLRGCVASETEIVFSPGGTTAQFSRIAFKSPDGPADLLLALRAIDVGGAVSAVATLPYRVLNASPEPDVFGLVVSDGLVATQTGATTVTAVGTFYDYGVHDAPFACLLSGADGIVISTEPPTKLGIVEDPDGFAQPTYYECKIDVTLTIPGTYNFSFWVRDKDGGESANFAQASVDVIAPQVTNASGDAVAGSLRMGLIQALPGEVIWFDPSLSGQTITLTEGELPIYPTVTLDASSLPAGLTISGNGASRVFNISSGANLTLKGLTIRDGLAADAGCILNGGVLDIVDSTITGCNADSVGAIRNLVTGSMTLTNTTVSGNRQELFGTILNLGVATLNHATVSDNHGSDDPTFGTGGILNFATLNLENSIVAWNTGTISDIKNFGEISASGENLIGDNSTVETIFPAGPLVGTPANRLNPGLNALGDYGGPTPVMLPVAGSPAIDAAIATDDRPAKDQRGTVRADGVENDLGAVERTESDVDVDTDGDSVADAIDNCLLTPNVAQLDSDGDNAGDVCDAFPDDAAETLDTDNDGIGNNADLDDDNDGVPDLLDDYPLGRFGDTPPGSFAFSFIEALGRSGITAGCGNGNYCPLAPVSRAQMAVFLERGMRGSDYSPPAPAGLFDDVGSSYWAAGFIEQFFVDGITAGCGNNNYCPEAEVTRDQMAVFLLRAKHGSGYSPPPATGLFDDVPLNHWAVHWIEQLAAEGITVGCGGGNYCPNAPLTRAQMAVFLVRTFGL